VTRQVGSMRCAFVDVGTITIILCTSSASSCGHTPCQACHTLQGITSKVHFVGYGSLAIPLGKPADMGRRRRWNCTAGEKSNNFFFVPCRNEKRSAKMGWGKKDDSVLLALSGYSLLARLPTSSKIGRSTASVLTTSAYVSPNHNAQARRSAE